MTIRRWIIPSCVAAGRVAMQLALSLTLSALVHAQTIIPADGKATGPEGFSFQGTWSCRDSSTAGDITISPAHHQAHGSTGLRGNWTELVEKDAKAVGHYFVGYDRDKAQFLMIDADDPAYAAYSSEGWRDRRLTLTPVMSQAQGAPWYRLIYEVQNPVRFTITWELQTESGWVVKTVSTCNRQKIRPRK